MKVKSIQEHVADLNVLLAGKSPKAGKK
jgi:hypothetical protein